MGMGGETEEGGGEAKRREKRGRMLFNLTANNKITVDRFDYFRLLKIIGIKY